MASEVFRIELGVYDKDETGPGLDSAGKKLSGFEKSAQKLQDRLEKMNRSKFQLALETADHASGAILGIHDKIKSLTGKIWSITMGIVDKATVPIRGIFNLLKNPIIQAGAILGVSVGVKDTIDTYASFESAMSKVEAISGATAREMESLTAKAKQMGATTKFTATEAGEAFTYMAMAGWKSGQMIDGIEGIMALAAADGLDLATTSDIVTDALTAFGLQAKDSSHFADVLAKASSNANTNVSLLGESFKYVAPVAGSFGFSIEDTAIALGIMANAGVKGSMSGTALRGALTAMLKPSKNAAIAMEEYGVTLDKGNGQTKSLMEIMENLRSSFGDINVSLFNTEGELKDYEEIMEEASNATGESASQLDKLKALSIIFGQRALPGMLSIIQTGTADFYALSDAIYHANGTAKNMSAIMLDNLAGDMTLLQSAAEAVKNTFGARLEPYLRTFIQWLTDRMPEVEKSVVRMMDFLDVQIDAFREKIRGMMNSDEWTDADFFGRIKIAWDTLILQPFSDWWDHIGKGWMENKMRGFGELLGGGMTSGMLTLLGVDASGAVGEGADVGSAFFEGFKSAFKFDEILDGLKQWSQEHPILSNLAKLWLGGKILTGVASVIHGSASFAWDIQTLGKSIKDIGGLFGIGSAVTGAGAAAAGTAGGGIIAAGAPFVLGGIGVASTFSGFRDLYNSNQRISKEETILRQAEQASGTIKLLLTGIGTGLGAVIGGPVGAAVGSGIGGSVGSIIGNKMQDHAVKQLEEAAEAARLESVAAEQAKFSSQALKDALADTSMTAQEFAQIFNNEVSRGLREHFGNIQLTVAEINTLAQELTNIGDNTQLGAFEDAVTSANAAYSQIQSTMSGMAKLDWKIGLGVTLNESELSDYQKGLDTFYSGVQTYLENTHYEATTAIKLLVGADSEFDFSGLNDMYAVFQEQIKNITTEDGMTYPAYINFALKDGIITTDEQAIIQSLQTQMSEIADKVANAQMTAELETLRIKYTGAALDYRSFTDLQNQLKAFKDSNQASFDQALTVTLTALNLQLDEAKANLPPEEFETVKEQIGAQINAAIEGYSAKINELELSIESFQLETIAEAYKNELENSGILIDIQNTTTDGLRNALIDALSAENLGADTQGQIATLLSAMGETLPENMAPGITAGFKNSTISSVFDSGLSDAINNSTLEETYGAIGAQRDHVDGEIQNAFRKGFSTTAPVKIQLQWAIENANPTVTVNGQTFTLNASIGASANGRIVDSPMVSLVGEAGPEAIIPLSASRRNRGLDLWMRAGEMLGVTSYADGGITNNITPYNLPFYTDSDDETPLVLDTRVSKNAHKNESGSAFSIRLDMPKELVIKAMVQAGTTGASADEIIALLTSKKRELTDLIGDDIANILADWLEQSFSNRPVKGVL